MTKSFIFEGLQTIHSRYIATSLRKIGQKLYKTGIKLSNGQLAIDRLQPCKTRIKLNTKTPQFSKYTFIAPNTTIIGNTTIADNTNIYYSNIIKSGSHNSAVHIGPNTNIQDLNTIKATNKHNTIIGERVYIGSNCFIENATVEDNAIIGNGAKMLRNSIVRKGGVLGAGAVLGEDEIVGENEIWVGSPAVFLRMSGPESEFREGLLEEFDKLSFILAEQYEKDGARLLRDQENLGESTDILGTGLDYIDENIDKSLDGPEQLLHQNFKFEANHYLEEKELRENGNKIGNDNEYDMQNFPENLNIHKKNYRFDEKFEKELLDDPTSKKTFFDEEQENSVDPEFKKKF